MDRGLYHGVYNILWLADLLFVLDLFRKHHHHHPNLISSRSGVWLRPSVEGCVRCWIDEGKGCLALSTFRRRRGRRNITAFLCCVRGGGGTAAECRRLRRRSVYQITPLLSRSVRPASIMRAMSALPRPRATDRRGTQGRREERANGPPAEVALGLFPCAHCCASSSRWEFHFFLEVCLELWDENTLIYSFRWKLA